MEKLRRELEAAVEALEQGRHELSSFAEQVWWGTVVTMIKTDISIQCDRMGE